MCVRNMKILRTNVNYRNEKKTARMVYTYMYIPSYMYICIYVYAKDVRYQSTTFVADSSRNGNKLTRRNFAPFRDVYFTRFYVNCFQFYIFLLQYSFCFALYYSYIIEMWQSQKVTVEYYVFILFNLHFYIFI